MLTYIQKGPRVKTGGQIAIARNSIFNQRRAT
jgi:hypothetical protein